MYLKGLGVLTEKKAAEGDISRVLFLHVAGASIPLESPLPTTFSDRYPGARSGRLLGPLARVTRLYSILLRVGFS